MTKSRTEDNDRVEMSYSYDEGTGMTVIIGTKTFNSKIISDHPENNGDLDAFQERVTDDIKRQCAVYAADIDLLREAYKAGYQDALKGYDDDPTHVL